MIIIYLLLKRRDHGDDFYPAIKLLGVKPGTVFHPLGRRMLTVLMKKRLSVAVKSSWDVLVIVSLKITK